MTEINTRALDAALNVLGMTMSLPVNTLIYNMHNALVAAEEAGEQQGYWDGYDAAMEWQDETLKDSQQSAYTHGYFQGMTDAQEESADEIERLENEVQQVANEQYEDGYLDAAHDFSLSPAAAQASADAIEEDRLSKINRAPVAHCPGCDQIDCDDICIFPVDAEDLQ